MTTDGLAFHYVCRPDEAAKLVADHHRFWVVECGCRKSLGNKCPSASHEICLWFHGDMHEDFGRRREISRDEVSRILRQARDENLVTRPFRNDKDRSITEGICFCCDDCCSYFQSSDEKCDKGSSVEQTDLDACSLCGDCESVCYFKARRLVNGSIKITHDNCHGCALCINVCPEEAIRMVKAG